MGGGGVGDVGRNIPLTKDAKECHNDEPSSAGWEKKKSKKNKDNGELMKAGVLGV